MRAEGTVVLCPWCPTATPVHAGHYFCREHQAEAAARARRDREADAQEHRGEWLDAIGVPRAQQGFSFATLDRTRCVELMEEFCPRVFAGRALLLLGPTGVGKTAAAIALLDSLLPDFQTRQCYELGLTLVRELGDFRARDLVIDRCTRARILVLDDLPRHRDDQRVAGLLEELLIIREAERRATVITSNVAPRSLATLLSDRVLDRLKAWGTIHSVAGASLRRAPEAIP